ncbi:DUF2688 domain-containing protein (plasmid) [Xanthomonas albilineans]|uniref:Probable kleb protein n=1 Tax=Xanthomonas albilineans (strain GPE PC73 / CFBP 7063) TaxID=380358 RepID=D6CK71_XANAP|nr:DUF2688 domain-containing protein [Xanthomonas albilineans]CAZ15860.1 probable kleb protein [Xanthomonas albilineans]
MSEKMAYVVSTHCRRCGTPLRTLRHSLLGLDDLKQRLGSICTACLIPEELAEIEQAQVEALTLAASIRRLQES